MTWWIARCLRLLFGRPAPELGDQLENGLDHYFTRAEVEEELASLGLEVVHYASLPYAHAVVRHKVCGPREEGD